MKKSNISEANSHKPDASIASPIKLTEMERKVLVSAAVSDAGAGAVPTKMNKRAAEKLGMTLIEKGLVRETKAKPGMPVWRTVDGGRTYALIITKAGRTTIQCEVDRKSAESIAAIEQQRNESEAAEAPAEETTVAAATRPDDEPIPFNAKPYAPREGSKLANVVALLARNQGADIHDLMSATGWLPHTTRATLTGLRKRGFVIERTRDGERRTIYRIVSLEQALIAA